METGRNDPCPCGSGKKFKRCHGTATETQPSPDDLTWTRLRRVLEGYPAMMLRFIDQSYGPDAVHEAWDEFTLWDSEEPYFDRDTPHLDMFLPWFFHHWAPDPLETSVEDPSLHDRPPTSVLLERRGKRLDPLLRRYLEACLAEPVSFHEVLRSDPGRGFRCREVFTGVERDVLDRSASRMLRPGSLFFGQLVSAEGMTLLEACGRYLMPPGENLSLIDLRERITGGNPISAEELEDWDIEIREAYLDWVDNKTKPRRPHLQNTDGEDIAFHRLLFEIDSPRAALAALKHLAFASSEEELLETAEFDEHGEVRSVAFSWTVPGNAKHRSWENTVHGEVVIDGRELRASTNSAERAARLRSILEERLGAGIRHKHTDVEGAEEAMAGRGAGVQAIERAELDDAPLPVDAREVQEKIREMIAAHYEGWIHEKIPALGGVTPLEAVKDRVGREKVQALLALLERTGARMDPPVDESVFAGMRERLGL